MLMKFAIQQNSETARAEFQYIAKVGIFLVLQLQFFANNKNLSVYFPRILREFQLKGILGQTFIEESVSTD